MRSKETERAERLWEGDRVCGGNDPRMLTIGGAGHLVVHLSETVCRHRVLRDME